MVGTGPPETCAGVAPDLTNGTVGRSLSRQTDSTISMSGVGPEISWDVSKSDKVKSIPSYVQTRVLGEKPRLSY